MVAAITSTSASEGVKKIDSSVLSEKTQKTLINNDGTKLVYAFVTNVTTYSDNTVERFLEGNINLTDVITYHAADSNDEIRFSVGWRNPQEDGYDVTSFTFKYDLDNTKITCEAIDGYSFGSIESSYYNWIYETEDSPNQYTKVNAGQGADYNGFYNTTIKQWTDMKSVDGATDYRLEPKTGLAESSQDVIKVSCEVNERPAYVDGSDKNLVK
jgi:hypothetical protein